MRLTNAENTIMTSLTIIIFNRLQLKPLGVYGKPTAPFLSCLANKLVVTLGYPRDERAKVAPPAYLSLAMVKGNAVACVQV